MGCAPYINLVRNEENIITGKCDLSEAPIIDEHVDIKNAKDFKIREGMLVQGSVGDPFKYYKEIAKIGEGAFGKVVKVQHNVSKVFRAMKIINKRELKLRKEEEKALITEIDTVKTLDHPNIMKVYEYFNTDDKLYIISEFCSGGELFDVIKESNYIKENVSQYIMKQIFSAVAFCHQNHIMHRDLKPENILIESKEELKKDFFSIKIIDFGTSEKLKKGTVCDTPIGTPYYIAPEVLDGKYDMKCDLWSCGVIMYVLLSGTQPFNPSNNNNKDDEDEIYRLVKKGQFNFDGKEWDNVSDMAKDLIKKLLEKKVSKRYSAKDSLEHPWIKSMMDSSCSLLDKRLLKDMVSNLRNYKADKKIQQSSLAYIVHNLTRREDTEFLKLVFINFDTNGDGRLTKDELINGLKIILNHEEAENEVNRLMCIIDVDGNGFIEYEEFLRAGLNKEKILTEDNLKTAFEMYDINKRKRVNAEELGKILGQGGDNVNSNVWEELIAEADLDGDGEINYDDFIKIMSMC